MSNETPMYFFISVTIYCFMYQIKYSVSKIAVYLVPVKEQSCLSYSYVVMYFYSYFNYLFEIERTLSEIGAPSDPFCKKQAVVQ